MTVTRRPPHPGVPVVDILSVLSLGADLGMGQPMEHVQRQVVIAMRMGEMLGWDHAELSVVCHAGLVSWVGCHVDAYEQAKWFGDDLALKGNSRSVDMTPGAEAMFTLRHIGGDRPLSERMKLAASFPLQGRRDAQVMIENHWFAANQLATRLGLESSVCHAVGQTFERWDGKGVPGNARGDEISTPAQLINFADVVAAFHQMGGVPAAREVAAKRSGTQFAPAIAEMFCAYAETILQDLDQAVLDWRRLDPVRASIQPPCDG